MDANDIEGDMGTFTLEDAYENLKDIRAEMMQEIDELVEKRANNVVNTIKHGNEQDQVRSSHHKLMKNLLQNLDHQEVRILPHPNTIDLCTSIVQDFQNVLEDMRKIFNMMSDIEKTKKNIAQLESKKAGLEKMKSACQGAIENVGIHPTYRNEIAVIKRLFSEVKEDLYTVVDTIFPDNIGFKEVLAELTQAYTKGGDDVYIDVTPDSLKFVKFLIEADIAVYHRNDKNKIKMTDLL